MEPLEQITLKLVPLENRYISGSHGTVGAGFYGDLRAVGADSSSAETFGTKSKGPHVRIFSKGRRKTRSSPPFPISQVDGGKPEPEQQSESKPESTYNCFTRQY